jgi:predicted nucleotidyltransferase
MPESVREIVCKFTQQIRVIYGASLKKIVLYGSYARGDYEKNSDIDVMILVDAGEDEIRQKFNDVCDLAFDFEMEYGIVISPLVKNEKHFMKWSDTLPFYRNVKQEGMTINEI